VHTCAESSSMPWPSQSRWLRVPSFWRRGPLPRRFVHPAPATIRFKTAASRPEAEPAKACRKRVSANAPRGWTV